MRLLKQRFKLIASVLLVGWMFLIVAWSSFLLFSDTSYYGWPLTFAKQRFEDPDNAGHYHQVEIYPFVIIAMCAASVAVGFLSCTLWKSGSRREGKP